MAGLDGKSTTRRPSANRFPTEILREIFELAIPTSYPSPVENNSLSTFIATTAPYNILRVSHSWKDLVLSIPSLWSSFFYSFSYPSDATLKVLICLIERHSERSHGLPLTSFVRLAGHYNHSLSRAIANLLSTHQSRWRSVGIWFETEGHEEGVRSSSRSVPAGMPVPKTQLFIEDLASLKDLHISFCTQYVITSRTNTGRSLRKSLPSLTSLDLLAPSERQETMRWLDLCPNLRELNINYGGYYGDYETQPPSYEIVIPQTHLTQLHLISPPELNGISAPIRFTLDHMTCEALKELHLQPGWASSNDALVALCDFFRRSLPSVLENFQLVLSDYLPNAAPIFEALTLMPSLRTLSIGWRDNWHLDIGELINELARTSDPSNPIAAFSLLPALENLEIVTTLVPPPPLIELVTTRRSLLKSVKLSRCMVSDEVHQAVGFPRRRKLTDFHLHDDLDRLPVEFEMLKKFIAEGLQFVVEN